MKKSISFLLLASLALAITVSAGNTAVSKKDYSVQAGNQEDVISFGESVPFALKNVDAFSFEPIEMKSEFGFIIANGVKETFTSGAGKAVKTVMFRLPNTYG